MIKSTSNLSFNRRLELFNKETAGLEDYIFSTTILSLKTIDTGDIVKSDDYIINEKTNDASVIIEISRLKNYKKDLNNFYFLLCEIVLSYIRNDDNNNIVVASRFTPISFIVLKQEKELWFKLYRVLHQESMSHFYMLKL